MSIVLEAQYLTGPGDLIAWLCARRRGSTTSRIVVGPWLLGQGA